MPENRLFTIVINMSNKYFPNSYKWCDLYCIAMDIIKRTQRYLLNNLKSVISEGKYKNPEATALLLHAELEAEAEKLFDEYKDTFPLKSAIKRYPAKVNSFLKECVDIGREEFCREMKNAIGFACYKLDA